MKRHRWAYEGAAEAMRNRCLDCGLEIGWTRAGKWHALLRTPKRLPPCGADSRDSNRPYSGGYLCRECDSVTPDPGVCDPCRVRIAKEREPAAPPAESPERAALAEAERVLRPGTRPSFDNEEALQYLAYGFRGKWVAVRDGKFMAAADTLDELCKIYKAEMEKGLLFHHFKAEKADSSLEEE